jgi:hypothetical protein
MDAFRGIPRWAPWQPIMFASHTILRQVDEFGSHKFLIYVYSFYCLGWHFTQLVVTCFLQLTIQEMGVIKVAILLRLSKESPQTEEYLYFSYYTKERGFLD